MVALHEMKQVAWEHYLHAELLLDLRRHAQQVLAIERGEVGRSGVRGAGDYWGILRCHEERGAAD